MSVQPRESGEIDALVTDGYLESLLAARERRAVDAPSVAELAAARLADGAWRIHPSFRFEERLATRLADTAARLRLAPAVGEPGSLEATSGVIELGSVGALRDPFGELGLVDPLDLADPARPEDVTGIPRPLVIGGTLASAALSIAGAALVAWRLNRAPRSGVERVRLA